MGDKSIQKKKFIIETARKVFATKGFRTVTMKDIVEACDISRGGLYLYFESCEDIFRAVLEVEKNADDPEIAGRLSEKPTCNEILTLFFLEQKKAILEKDTSLITAMYEYSFSMAEKSGKAGRTLLDNQKNASIKFLTGLLNEGVQKGEFNVAIDDIPATAAHIVYTIEGIKLFSRTGNITETDVNNEFVILLKQLLPKQ